MAKKNPVPYKQTLFKIVCAFRELSPDRMEDFEDGEMEDEYDAIPAYEAPHKRKEDRKEEARNTVDFSKTLKNRKSGPKLPK